MWLGKIMEIAALSETDSIPLEVTRALRKDSIIHFRAKDREDKWKEYAVQILRESPVWSLDTGNVSCTETVVPAGVDSNDKLLFYPAVNIPQVPLKHNEVCRS